MRIILSFLISLFTIFTLNQAKAQNQKYTIYWGDDQIGLMSVSRVKSGDKVDYTFKADVEFRVILKYNRTTEFGATYIRDTLISCYSKSVMNDNLKDHQTTERVNNNYYEIFQHPDENSKLEETILESVAILYYQEPKPNLNRIYAEGYSKFCKLEKLEPSVYLLQLTEDKSNIYRYINGKLNQVEVKRTWFDLTFKRI